MANERKETKKYTFTVEGETEKWYLEWLQARINSQANTLYNVSIVAKVQQSPRKYAKTINPLSTPIITHIFDYESNSSEHIKNVLTEIKEANSIKGKKFKYTPAYSNLTFELWMVLHKQSCNCHLTNRTQYLRHINRAYAESFESLEQYKEETNFKRCLSKLSLENVFAAIHRAKIIMDIKTQNGEVPTQHDGFYYYTDNPALTIFESIEKILKECGLI